MKILPQTSLGYFNVLCEPDEVTKYKRLFLNYSSRKFDDPKIKVEDNFVNRIILGLEIPFNYDITLRDIPKDLYPYQVMDIQLMSAMSNVLNCNKMGMGKTVETIITLKNMNARNAVIIAPKVVCSQWKDQIEKWWPEVSVSLFKIDPKCISIMNYDKLLNKGILLQLQSFTTDCLVFDEIHYLKNRNSKRSKAALQIPSLKRIGLTGTPILNRPDDLYNILYTLDPHIVGNSYWSFVEYFCETEQTNYAKQIIGLTTNKDHLQYLKLILNKVTVYNTSTGMDVQKREVDVLLDMSASQKAMYQRVQKMLVEELPEDCTISNAAVRLIRLRQVTSTPRIFDTVGNATLGVKLEWITEFCKNTEEQVVIFTAFATTAHILQDHLRQDGITAVTYTGTEDDAAKTMNKIHFSQGKYQVIIGTIGAMGTGVDGLQCARLVIMIDIDWSPEINNQAIARVYRKGQSKNVMVYKLKCRNSIDEFIDYKVTGKEISLKEILK